MLGCISGRFTALTCTGDGTEPLPCGHLLFTTSCVDLLRICVPLPEPPTWCGQGLRQALQRFAPALGLAYPVSSSFLVVEEELLIVACLGPPMPGKYPTTESRPLPVWLVGLVFGFGDGGLTR